MEEWIGQWWHRAISRAAEDRHADAAVTLAQMHKPIGLLFRAGGGAHAVRLAAAGAQTHGGARGWLQRVAGSGGRADTARLSTQVLALPERIDVFDDATLNRALYLWLAALASQVGGTSPGSWLVTNLQAAQRVLRHWPGLAPRLALLLAATRRLRPAQPPGRAPARVAEAGVQAALTQLQRLACGADLDPAALAALPAVRAEEVAPLWLFLQPDADAAADPAARPDPSGSHPQPGAANPADPRRRQAQRVQECTERHAMLMFFRAESLLTWGEFVRVNRATDDDENPHAQAAANDMDRLSIAPDGRTSASRVRFDLDLPSAAEDDELLAEGPRLPEWDHRQQRLRPAHCAVQVLQAHAPPSFVPAPALRRTAGQVRRRMELLRQAPAWQRGLRDGDELDLDAWVRSRGEGPQDDPPVHARRTRGQRCLATLLLADLSLSTDAHVRGTQQRVIEVIRDALYVVGDALNATGDAFAMQGFSSVRRANVRIQHLKGFDEPWGAATQARVGAVKPGYYTRMGAALRHATAQLLKRPERTRLLLLLTDGKPNDLDVYEGRYGLEDTRHAVQEARDAGLQPFAVTVDESGHDWLPYLFGRQGYALVHRPQQLPQRLAQVVASLTRGQGVA